MGGDAQILALLLDRTGHVVRTSPRPREHCPWQLDKAREPPQLAPAPNGLLRRLAIADVPRGVATRSDPGSLTGGHLPFTANRGSECYAKGMDQDLW